MNEINHEWTSRIVAINGDVYACTYDGDVYKQVGGKGEFLKITTTNQDWSGLAVDQETIYAKDSDDRYYKQVDGIGDFIIIEAGTEEEVLAERLFFTQVYGK
jgi:sporulation protein YlmC with PRC-barrel domain